MNDIKITASFVLPGSVMDKTVDSNKEYKNYELIQVRTHVGKDSYKTITVRIPKCKQCTQTLNMSMDAYTNMLTTPVQGTSPKHWVRMPASQRIEAHLREIQAGLRATGFTYIIYED